MKKLIALSLILVLLCGAMTACAHEHVYKDATCTTPKTCTECGETVGEPLGHSWKDADCTTPKTCEVCGETEGEALGHEFTDANYQEAMTCQVCGEIEGEPLTPDFVTYGIDCINATEGGTLEFVTDTRDNAEATTVGKLTVLNYEVVSGRDTLEEKDGYEWKILDLEFRVDDDNARTWGYNANFRMEDYYNISFHDDTSEYNGDSTEGTFKVNYYGEEMDAYFMLEMSGSQWYENNAYAAITLHLCLQVPTGYDGFVFGLCKPIVGAEEDNTGNLSEIYNPETFALVRFN